MKQLKDLKNLGNTIIKNLNKIDIYSVTDLENTGPVGVYREITDRYPNKTWSVCYYLYSIEGALKHKHWDDIGKKRKQELLKAVGKA